MFERNLSNNSKLLVIVMALLLLSIPTSAEIDNCCFVDRQCDADREWVNGYWAFQNSQCAAQSQPQAETSEAVNNCCFTGWQCTTDEEWVNGYYAFQNNQCAAPSRQQQPRSSQSQPQTETSEVVNNCCFTGWQCTTDEEWTSGYWAFQRDQCDSGSQWQGQQRQRPSGNQQVQSGNQQRQSGNQQQHVQAQDDNPQAQEQSSGNQNSATLGEEPGSYQATIDLSNPQPTTHELEDGTFVDIQRITLAEICAAYPDWDLC